MVVVLKVHAFYDATTITIHLQSHMSLAPNFLTCPVTLPFAVTNTCCVLTLPRTSYVATIRVALAPLQTKACVLGICIVEFECFIKRTEMLTNDWYQIFRELWCVYVASLGCRSTLPKIDGTGRCDICLVHQWILWRHMT